MDYVLKRVEPSRLPTEAVQLADLKRLEVDREILPEISAPRGHRLVLGSGEVGVALPRLVYARVPAALG